MIERRDQSNSMISIKERKSSENTNTTKGLGTAMNARGASPLNIMNIKASLLNPASVANLGKMHFDESYEDDIRHYNHLRR